LKNVYKLTVELPIFRDKNTDYLIESNEKKLVSLLTTYNLSNTFYIVVRIQNNSYNVIDNIFVDNSRIN